ncbi:hypothetical protein [Sulfolobus super-elliptical virus]|nr:hypothetical protein [Sulfolobus super-elliptical virus]
MKRNGLEIIADILETIQNGNCSKSSIIKNANLSVIQAKKYLQFLLNNKLIITENSRYLITEKGRKFIMQFRRIRQLEIEIYKNYEELTKMIYDEEKI